jgi:hypothetical protein
MRNRIKGLWSWAEIGIVPDELSPSTGAIAPAAVADSGSGTNAALVLAGSVLAGVALAWVLRRVLSLS